MRTHIRAETMGAYYTCRVSTHHTLHQGGSQTSCLSFLYLSMLLLVCLRLSWCLLSPLSSSDTPPCPPSQHRCSGPALSLVGRIQATRARTHALTKQSDTAVAAAQTQTHTPVNPHGQTQPSGGAGSLLDHLQQNGD